MSNTADNVAIGGTLTVTGASTFTGAITATGGVTGDVTGDVTGHLDATGEAPIVLPTIAFASLPAATVAGQLCFCTTGSGGNPGVLFSNGTNWIDVMDGATAAET